MTGEPLPAECAEVRQRLAEGKAGREVPGHLAGCPSCSAFAAALVELGALLARLPLPEPPAGAADRAMARFRAEFAAQGSPGTAPLGPPSAAPPWAGLAPVPAIPSPTPPPPPSAATTPPSHAPPAWPPRAGQARGRRWRRPVRLGLAVGVAAVIALVVALVAVLGPTSAPPAYAAILREAAVRTGAEKSARFDLTGAIGFSESGHTTTAALNGTGATEFPNRGELSEVAIFSGRPLLRLDTVSVGDRVWTRTSGGQWVLVPIPPDHASPIDQALDYPAQALADLTRVGTGYRSLGTTTVSGTQVRQIQVTIPGDSFHAFGDLPQQVNHWTVVADVSQAGLILRRLTITGRGVVGVLAAQEPFTYSLQLTLRDFGARVTIAPPGTGPQP